MSLKEAGETDLLICGKKIREGGAGTFPICCVYTSKFPSPVMTLIVLG